MPKVACQRWTYNQGNLVKNSKIKKEFSKMDFKSSFQGLKNKISPPT